VAIKAEHRKICFLVIRIVLIDMVYLHALAALAAYAARAIMREKNFGGHVYWNR
jgi:hypothetical protein